MAGCRRVLSLPRGGPTNEASWDTEDRVTTQPFDLSLAPFARGFFPGDYTGLGTDGSDFLPLFTQTSSDDPATQWFARVG